MKLYWILIMLLLSRAALGQEAWTLVKQDSHVAVYTKQQPGSGYKSFRAVGIVKSTPQKLLEIINDVNSYRHWFAFSNSVKLLTESENEKYFYMETKMPWPFENQDMVYKICLEKNNDSGTKLTLNGSPEFVPAVSGINRMRSVKGFILLQPEEQHTTVIYVMHAELGGDIPPWLANNYIHLLPFQTLNNLIRFAQEI